MKKTPQTLVLVRHAESVFNVARPAVSDARFLKNDSARNLLGNNPDHRIELSAAGIASLEKTGAFIRQKFGVFDAAYHSGFTRTKKTLDGILSAYTPEEREKILVRKSQLIRERDAGYTYNLIEQEVLTYFPWLQSYWKFNGTFFARPVGGESIATVADRIEMFLRFLGEDYPSQKILVTLHGRALAALRFVLEDWTYEQAEEFIEGPSPSNCGITVYEYSKEEKKLVLREYDTCPVV